MSGPVSILLTIEEEKNIMRNHTRLLFFSLLLLSFFVATGNAFGLGPSGSGSSHAVFDLNGVNYRLNQAGLMPGRTSETKADLWPDKAERPIWLAQADTEKKEEAEISEECKAFRADPEADIGDMIRAGCQPTTGQMSALMDNPLGNVAMLFTQVDVFVLENPTNNKDANKVNYMGIAQFPKGLGENWNLINRIVWNVPSMPLDQGKIDRATALGRISDQYASGPGGSTLPPTGSPIAPIDLFDGRTTGFGDMYYVGLFAPKKGIKTKIGGNFLWGAGFDLGFPTASKDLLGTGKWTAGPSALGVYMGPKWKIGALLQQYWDYAGDSDRDDVNLTNLQYFIFYSLDEVTSIGAAPNIIANWEQDSGNKWTVPIGLGISRTFQFGKVPVRFGFEVHYSVIQPDDVAGQKWDFRFYMIPAMPSALFKWMQ
jgi:hypothetical protein